jgi:hypothetical protein
MFCRSGVRIDATPGGQDLFNTLASKDLEPRGARTVAETLGSFKPQRYEYALGLGRRVHSRFNSRSFAVRDAIAVPP